MGLLFIIGCVIAYKLWKYYDDNRSVGVLDWDKLKHFTYYKGLSDEQIRRLKKQGFFTDQEATRKLRERNKNRW